MTKKSSRQKNSSRPQDTRRLRRARFQRHYSPSLDDRLESVCHALALAHQSFLHLGTAIHEESFEDFEGEAIYALSLVIKRAQNDARIVSEALPAPVRALGLPDDYQGPTLGGEPLQPLLDEYRRRSGEDAFTEAMVGRPGRRAR